MKPVDVRNVTFDEIRARLDGDRWAVYEALLASRTETGLTARELAARMRRDVLSVAPRLTELVQLGLAWMCGRRGRRGLYEAIPLEAARKTFEAVQAMPRAEQPLLGGLA